MQGVANVNSTRDGPPHSYYATAVTLSLFLNILTNDVNTRIATITSYML